MKKSLFSVFFLVLISFVLLGCDNGKTTETVFPNTALAACASQAVQQRYIVQWEDGRYTIETTPEGVSDEQFKDSFVKKNLALLKYVEKDYRVRVIKNSSDRVEQAAVNLNWGPAKIEADYLWNLGFTGRNIKVGVVDGFVDASHVQLAGNIFSAEQFNSETNNPALNKHGTHVAGIIAADPRYGSVGGVAPSAQIISGQFIGNDGGGSLGDAIIAMNSVANKGARVINMSWGGAPCVQNLQSAVKALSDRGILIVTASGNEGVNSDYSPTYPAAFSFLNQINVAASTTDDFLISFSNRGYRTVNVAAPGVGIYSTVPGNRIESMDGTSMAAPLVAGTAALLWSAFPNASSQQIKSAIYSSIDIPSGRDFQVSTRGRINARKAYDQLRLMLTSP